MTRCHRFSTPASARSRRSTAPASGTSCASRARSSATKLALEAVQDAFAGAIRSQRRYRGEGPLEAWLWRAVVNAAQKTRLREARGGLPAEPEGGTTAGNP